MSGRSVLLLATSGLLAAGAAFSAVSGTFSLGSENLALSSKLSVDDWTIRTDEAGRTVITEVQVAGVPASVVGRTLVVYLQGANTSPVVASIDHPGSVRVPVTDPVPADGVKSVAIAVTG